MALEAIFGWIEPQPDLLDPAFDYQQIGLRAAGVGGTGAAPAARHGLLQTMPTTWGCSIWAWLIGWPKAPISSMEQVHAQSPKPGLDAHWFERIQIADEEDSWASQALLHRIAGFAVDRKLWWQTCSKRPGEHPDLAQEPRKASTEQRQVLTALVWPAADALPRWLVLIHAGMAIDLSAGGVGSGLSIGWLPAQPLVTTIVESIEGKSLKPSTLRAGQVDAEVM